MVNKLLVILAQGLFIVACDRREPASDMVRLWIYNGPMVLEEI